MFQQSLNSIAECVFVLEALELCIPLLPLLQGSHDQMMRWELHPLGERIRLRPIGACLTIEDRLQRDMPMMEGTAVQRVEQYKELLIAG